MQALSLSAILAPAFADLSCQMLRSLARVVLAMIEAAAMLAESVSPLMMPRCGAVQ